MNRSFEVASRRLVLPAVLALALAACTGGQKGDPGDTGPAGPAGATGDTGPQGVTGAAGSDGKNSLTASAAEPFGVNCPTGGVRVDFGLDVDGNGALDPAEVDPLRTQYLCAGPVGPAGATGAPGTPGATGASGKNSLVATAPEAPGANCATGGARVQYGVDDDGSGALEPGEVDAALTRYICDGAQGPQGIQGATGATGAPGTDGANGTNGTNGVDGKNTLTATAAEAAGANCATGGTRVDHGLDANGNGILDAAEVNATLRRYICNGAQGPQGIPGSTGAQGTPGTLGAYGDGSAGALNIATATDWSTTFPGANLQFTDVNLAAGVTWIVPSGTIIRATGNVTIAGTITVLPGTADNGQLRPPAGVAIAAATQQQPGIGLSRLASAHLVRIPAYGGGAGARNAFCTGGEGGGSFAIYAKGTLNVTAAASINANGNSSANTNPAGINVTGAGGGAGGMIVLIGKTSLLMSGALRVVGGNGAPGFDGPGGNAEGGGGGGGGGIIHLLSSTAPSVTGTTLTGGGAPGATAGTGPTVNPGAGGGACGGSGGAGGITGVVAAAGASGQFISSTMPTPESLLL